MTDEGFRELERQVEHGNLFVHAELTEQATRANQIEAVVQRARRPARPARRRLFFGPRRGPSRLNRKWRSPTPGRRRPSTSWSATTATRPSCPPRRSTARPACPYCKAVCCRLRFALTVEEIENGPVKWDLGRPYFNRHRPERLLPLQSTTRRSAAPSTTSARCPAASTAAPPTRASGRTSRRWRSTRSGSTTYLGAERSPIEIFMEAREGSVTPMY